MPITQERHIALLSACDALSAYVLTLQHQLPALDSQITQGLMTHEQAYNALANIINEAKLPVDALLVLERERTLFRRNARRSPLAREYLRRNVAGEPTLQLIAQGGPTPATTYDRSASASVSVDLSQPLDDPVLAQFRLHPEPERRVQAATVEGENENKGGTSTGGTVESAYPLDFIDKITS